MTQEAKYRSQNQSHGKVCSERDPVGDVPGGVARHGEDGGGGGGPDPAQEPLEVVPLPVHHVHGPLDPGVRVVQLILPFLGAKRHFLWKI